MTARTGDFARPDELALTNPRLPFGPWPDEMLARLLRLCTLTAGDD